MLTAGDAVGAEAVRLFHIPERLQVRWWEFAAGQADGAGKQPLTFTQVAGEISEFLEFKRLPLPRPSTLEVAVSGAEQPSTKPEMAGLAADWSRAGLCGGINLGDQESSLLIINLGEAQLRDRVLGLATSASFSERMTAFLRSHLDYPVLRIRLQPCEGYWLPATEFAMDSDTRDSARSMCSS